MHRILTVRILDPEEVIKMGQCFSVDYTGMSNGMPVDECGPLRPTVVPVGRIHEFAEFDLDYDGPREVRIMDRSIPLDRDHTPTIVTCRDGSRRIARVQLIQQSGSSYLRTPVGSQAGCFVRIDTRHTDLCEDGGYWEVLRGNPEVVMSGHEGLHTFKVHHRGGPFGNIDPFSMPNEDVDYRTAWKIGLLLMMPGDALEIYFKAPGGKYIGRLVCTRPDMLHYELVSSEIDETYEWQPPDYQEEKDLNDSWREWEQSRRDPFDDY